MAQARLQYLFLHTLLLPSFSILATTAVISLLRYRLLLGCIHVVLLRKIIHGSLWWCVLLRWRVLLGKRSRRWWLKHLLLWCVVWGWLWLLMLSLWRLLLCLSRKIPFAVALAILRITNVLACLGLGIVRGGLKGMLLSGDHAILRRRLTLLRMLCLLRKSTFLLRLQWHRLGETRAFSLLLQPRGGIACYSLRRLGLGEVASHALRRHLAWELRHRLRALGCIKLRRIWMRLLSLSLPLCFNHLMRLPYDLSSFLTWLKLQLLFDLLGDSLCQGQTPRHILRLAKFCELATFLFCCLEQALLCSNHCISFLLQFLQLRVQGGICQGVVGRAIGMTSLL
mmetsp:Transcript_2398/g.3583  ORF Transcript_2398/g.3583 Transcript_2398/m.3583 type:complete len:339 (-) Transcript_2398:340-1356(-)